ncbi:tyrosine-protein phosphatase [Desertibacillus haloalkaliphilus]|uniref:tyrosine-protein phosphatase n=1 Tax=Desertibacillus haloalkaliphilus TaxID=1328930 RepID=UPI001C273840|nr:CpsB/CapC family capsule biosynthesis tyrosine phosphatase [Desertibacillus haloalkaliphilus]MBU8906562.1 tyrosine protein phosphatase [Desertibacillus haloalkaliphilus]
MIDIHSHILAGVDDGAKDIDASLEMARAAVEEGITTIIATPHHKNGQYENTKKEIIEATEQLNERLLEEGIDLKVIPGQENRIYGELIEDFSKGEILTIGDGGKFVLIELPSNHVPRYTGQMLFDLQLQGLTPIIVHPERNSELIEHPDMLYKFVKNGAFTQVTASSIAGLFGKKIKKFSEQLIEANLTHFVASDAHNVTSRAFHMNAAYLEIEKKFGTNAVYMFKENAEFILDGQHPYMEPPERVKRKKFLGIF